MKEEWKIYKKTRGNIWEVSNFGRVKKNGEIHGCRVNNNGYLCFSGNFVHRAVAEMFIPNPENKPCVDHIDTNILNNHVDNLRWVTQKENNNNPLTRKHNSEAQKGKNRSGEQNGMFGKNHSEKSKEKNSNWHKGRHIVLCADGKRHWV